MDPQDVSVTVSTPGIIYNDLIILGSATGEGYNASPGHIRAYNVLSGDFEWIFNTIPQEDEYGHYSWTFYETENYGAANNWGGMSLDEEKGIVYVPTGSPSYDFYGGTRPGENLFGNCILALEAATGKRIWHYQVVHHDLWDYDLSCAPNLATILHKGRERDVVIQPTKMGTLFVLDRYTGELLSDAPEQRVPASDLDEEQASITQPMPQDLILVRQEVTEDDLTDISPEAHAFAMEQFKRMKHGRVFTPPSTEGTIMFPGTRGGVLWGGASYDQENKMLYVNANEYPMIIEMEKVVFDVSEVDMAHEGEIKPKENKKGKEIYLLNCASCHGKEKEGVPGAFPGLIGIEDKYPRDEIASIIKNGKGRMPPYTQFKGQDMEALLDYIMNIKKVPEMDTLIRKEKTKYVLKGYNKFFDNEGYPGVKPPWGTLSAVNMNNFKIEWQVPLGEYPELAKKGIQNTGTQTFGGCVATSGGLIFIGGTADEKFRAFHARTGEVLWEYQLPFGGYATPAIYKIGDKQYIVIAAGGGNRNGTPSGDAYMAFTLND